MSRRRFVPALLLALLSMTSLAMKSPLAAQDASGGKIAKAQPTEAPPADALSTQNPSDDTPDVEVKAQPTEAKPVSPAKATPKSAVPSVRPLSVTVRLVSQDDIEGTLTDTTELQMQTSFGTASIPLSEVAGVRFASANDATTTVVMLNGDSITGATDVKLITVETEWGSASINGPSIASIMFVPGLKWNAQSGLNGKRWSLSDEKTDDDALPAPATGTNPRSSGSLPSPDRTPPPSNPGFSSPQSFPSSNGQPFYPNR